MTDEVKSVAVIGAGTMGNGIAHVLARAGYNVFLNDVQERLLDQAIATIDKNLEREVKKAKIADSDKSAALLRITPTTDIAILQNADFVIEAVPEQMDLKIRVLQAADAAMRSGVILASNTSSISITHLAAKTSRAETFMGMHFMNPVPVMPLVEVIRGLATTENTFQCTISLCERLGKKPVAVGDSPGFVANRILLPMINEAAFTVMEGIATPQAIDTVLKTGMNHPMGPLELADFIGLDVCVHILEVLY
jgi:3-hydroxybutyryl-CoA dehydrogenase